VGNAVICSLWGQGGTLDITDRIDEEDTVVDPDPVGKDTPADLTRYLAAAAYEDEAFRDEVVFQTLYQKHRFIAPSYGVNIGSVVRHCLASRRLSRRRDLILSALIFLGVWALHLPLLPAVAVFVGGVLVAVGLASPRLRKLRWKIALSVVAYVAFLAFALHPLSLLTALAAFFVVFADLYERQYRVVAQGMDAKKFKPDAPAYGRERPKQHAADMELIAHLEGHQDGNVLVYTGFSPFIGSGIELKRWSFAVNVKGAREPVLASSTKARMERADIYAHVMQAMKDLDLDGCTVADTFYVNGRYVGTDEKVFFHPRGPGDRFPRLRYNIPNSDLEVLPPEAARQYADIKVVGWASDLILSAFVRFSQAAQYLFVEVSYFVLPPIKARYYGINLRLHRPTAHGFLRLVVDSATRTPLLWLTAPLRVAKWIAHPITRARRERQVKKAIREVRRFDYGALGSIREAGSDNAYGKYFQKVDIERLQKIIDRHLFASISEFLKEKGVDTSELELNMQFIVNQGLWASGGYGAGAGNVAAGTGAKIGNSGNVAGKRSSP
jgi:hypothetical protein